MLKLLPDTTSVVLRAGSANISLGLHTLLRIHSMHFDQEKRLGHAGAILLVHHLNTGAATNPLIWQQALPGVVLDPVKKGEAISFPVIYRRKSKFLWRYRWKIEMVPLEKGIRSDYLIAFVT